MRVLIVTQVVDTEDPALGFFVRWIEEFAKRAERVEVVCLKEGKHPFARGASPRALPGNVRVHSLGKTANSQQPTASSTAVQQYSSTAGGRGVVGRKFTYAWRFLRLAWKLRDEYDAVFVHMNQEYVLLAGWLWTLLGKRVYMWRNHYAGSLLTDIAAAFCTNVFCTSKHSYTAKYAKTILMPVGVDAERFKPDTRVARKPRSILFLSRMAPSKRPDLLIDALAELAHEEIIFTATLVGSPLSQDETYYETLKEKVRSLSLADKITFLPAVPHEETPALYRAHEIFVNASPSGMFDKTLFEAAASGCAVLAASDDFAELAGQNFHFSSSAELAENLKKVLDTPASFNIANVAERHALSALAVLLARTFAHKPRRLRALVWRLLFTFARALPHSPRMTVLLYHSISDAPDFFAVSPYEFGRHMRFLKARFDVVPLSRAFAHAAGSSVARDSVALTFDDGYRDFVITALPILEQYAMPATVFVLGASPDRKELGNEFPLITADDAPFLKSPLISVGSHALSHKKLTGLPLAAAKREMEESLSRIGGQYGKVPDYLAYPKGSYNDTVKNIATAAGYRGAVSVIERGVRTGDDAYALPRVQIDGDTSAFLFEAKLSPAADWYYRLWKIFH